jgi:putative aldouronate transport system permease protein
MHAVETVFFVHAARCVRAAETKERTERMKRILRIWKFRELIVLSLPGILFLFVFSYIPMYGIVLPFKNFRYDLGFWKSPWVGFRNFSFLFGSDNAWRITRNTLLLNSLFIVVMTVVAIALALMLYEVKRRSVKVYQTALFLPYFLSWVVASYIVLALLDMDKGLVNKVLIGLGAEPHLWYNEPGPWPVILLLANTWKGAGYSAIIYYAGLLNINKEFYEAAEIDGATRLQQIRLISLPLLSPLITILFLLAVGRIFYGNFDLFYNLTRNSTMLYPTTDVIDTFVYRALRVTGDIGMSSAAGIYQSVVGFFIVLLSNLLVKRINPDNALF